MVASKQKLSLVKMMLLFLLFFQAVGGKDDYVYVVAGDEVALPCHRRPCSRSRWLYWPGYVMPVEEAKNGQIVRSSARSHRLALRDDCSLVIRRTQADDAGLFECDPDNDNERLFLTVMTLTWSPWEGDPSRSGEGELRCSVYCWPRYECRCSEIRWRDSQGQELPPERVRQDYCRSGVPIVPGDSPWNYTCQYVRKGEVKIQAGRALDSPAVTQGGPGPGAGSPEPPQRNVLIGVGVAAVVAVLLAVLVAVLVKSRRNADRDVPKHGESDSPYANVTYDRETETSGRPQDRSPEEPEAAVTYATVSVKKKKTTTAERQDQHPQKQVLKQEAEAAVTYAAIRGASQR
ncbi:uncharacterized protein LOC144064350 [Stigmatopora argus]